LYRLNIRVNNYSVEFSFPFALIEDEYLYDDSSISLNSIRFSYSIKKRSCTIIYFLIQYF
jgi:hypothetical protein